MTHPCGVFARIVPQGERPALLGHLRSVSQFFRQFRRFPLANGRVNSLQEGADQDTEGPNTMKRYSKVNGGTQANTKATKKTRGHRPIHGDTDEEKMLHTEVPANKRAHTVKGGTDKYGDTDEDNEVTQRGNDEDTEVHIGKRRYRPKTEVTQRGNDEDTEVHIGKRGYRPIKGGAQR